MTTYTPELLKPNSSPMMLKLIGRCTIMPITIYDSVKFHETCHCLTLKYCLRNCLIKNKTNSKPMNRRRLKKDGMINDPCNKSGN